MRLTTNPPSSLFLHIKTKHILHKGSEMFGRTLCGFEKFGI